MLSRSRPLLCIKVRTFDRSAGVLGKTLDRFAGKVADRARGLARIAQCAGLFKQIGGKAQQSRRRSLVRLSQGITKGRIVDELER